MRLIVLFLIGLAMGSVTTAMLLKTLARDTAYPDAVMNMMGQQMKAIHGGIDRNSCAPGDLTPRLQSLRLVANDIEPAFADMKAQAQFGRYAVALREAADKALSSAPANCAAMSAELTSLKKTCDNCHRDYKG